MNLTLGCKCWSRGLQYGFRVYADGVRVLIPLLTYPSTDGRWSSLAHFCGDVLSGKTPPAYSRSLTVSDGSRTIQATATMAKHGRSFQGYVTAPRGSWLWEYVDERMGRDLACEYLAQPNHDFVLIPEDTESVREELDEIENDAREQVRAKSKRMGHGPPPNAKEIGLYFETLEAERLTSQFPTPTFQVQHRFPEVESRIPVLRKNKISCDIDVTKGAGTVIRCVEVKSVAGVPGTAFDLSSRQWESRIWCKKSQVPYDVVVYYHARCRVIERLVIGVTARLRREPRGFLCYPI